MTSPRITIFGGNADQVYQVIQLIPRSCAISLFSLEQELNEKHIHPKPSLVLIITSGSDTRFLPCLQTIRQRPPDTPVVVLGEDPEKEDIIQAFRFGIADYLLFPLDAEIFSGALEKYLQQQDSSSLRSFFHHWVARFGWRPNKDATRGQPMHASPFLKPPADAASEDFPVSIFPQEQELHELNVHFFGSFSIWAGGKKLPMLPGEKVKALLAYFLYNYQKPVHREKLLSKFWGYTDPSCARNSMNVAIHNIRRHFLDFFPDREFIQYENGAYLLNPTIDINTDAERFLRHWKQGRSLDQDGQLEEALPDYHRAVSLYGGDFLENIHYEEWCESERDQLKETYLQMLDRLGAHYFQKEQFRAAIQIFKKMLSKDNCLEAVHRKVILSYYQLGQRDKAVKQYHKCVSALQQELNIEPSQRTRELIQLIKAEKNIPSFLI